MTLLQIDILLEGISDEELADYYDQNQDQIEELKKAIEQKIKELPLGKYYRELDIW
jgi:hypothetical protein